MPKQVNFKVSEYPVGASNGGIVGLDTARDLIPLVFEGSTAIERTNLGRQYKDLHRDSITAQEDLALWNAYLMAELGKLEPGEEQREVLDFLYSRFGQGHVCDNAVDYNDPGSLRSKKGYARAAIFTRLEGFRFNRDSGVWEVIQGEGTMVHDFIPGTGFPELTNDGAYHPETGFPFSTASRKQAEASYTSRGFSPEFARMAVSKFWSQSEGAGVKAVDRCCNDGGYGGRFSLYANNDPRSWDPNFGSFHVSRSPSGARRAQRKAE